MKNKKEKTEKELNDIFNRNAENNLYAIKIIKVVLCIILAIFVTCMLIQITSILKDIAVLKELKNELSQLSAISPTLTSITTSSVNSSISILERVYTTYIFILIIGSVFGIALISLTNKVKTNLLLSDIIMKKTNIKDTPIDNDKQTTENKKD